MTVSSESLDKYSDNSLLDGSEGCLPESNRLAELISRYMKTVIAYATKYSKVADYEELVSDGMQSLLGAIRSYDSSKGEFSTYVGVCINNRMKNVARRTLSRTAHFSDNDGNDEGLERVPDPAPTPEELVMQREEDKQFFENLKQGLSELELHCIEGVIMGFSYEEIASGLGTDKKSVDNALSRARTKLRRFYNL